MREEIVEVIQQLLAFLELLVILEDVELGAVKSIHVDSALLSYSELQFLHEVQLKGVLEQLHAGIAMRGEVPGL